jgi:hypothetical protein
VSVYNGAGQVDVVIDLAGWFSAPGGLPASAGLYRPLVPGRLLDTRAGTPLGPGQSLTLPVLGAKGVPASGVGAVALNVTVTNPSAAGYVTVYPGGTLPLASNLNFIPRQTVANRVLAKLGASGQVTIFNSSGNVDLVVDVGGWFTDGSQPASGGKFTGLTPARIVDTRYGVGGPQLPVGAGESRLVPVAGQGGVPASGVNGVAINLTVTNGTAPSHLTLFPSDASRPLASDINFVAGQTVANLVLVKLGIDGRVLVYNAAGTTDVVVDVLGWFN